MKRLLVLLFTLLAAITGGEDRVVLIEGRSGDMSQQQSDRGRFDELSAVLKRLGFAPETIRRPTGGKPELAAALTREPLQDGDELWVFLSGRVQIGRNRIYCFLPQGVIDAATLRGLLDRAGGKQLIFLLTGNGVELMNLLRGPNRTIVAFAQPSQPDAPPHWGGALVRELSAGEAVNWCDLLRRATLCNQKNAEANHIMINELPQMAVEMNALDYPILTPDESKLPRFRRAAPLKPVELTDGTRIECVISSTGAMRECVEVTLTVPEKAEPFRSFALFRPGAVRHEVERLHATGVDGAPLQVEFNAATGTVAIPKAAPGCRISWRYTMATDDGGDRFGGVNRVIGLARAFEQSRLEFSLTIPDDLAVYFKFYNLEPTPKIQETRSADGKRFAFTTGAIPALPGGAKNPAIRPTLPLLAISTAGSYEEILAGFMPLLAGADAVDAKCEREVRSWVDRSASPSEVLETLYKRINALEYRTYVNGLRSVRPRLPGEMLRSGWGDCKDKANALIALAGLFGIRGEFVLLNRGSWTDPEFPGWRFNHALAYFPEVDGGLWLDATDPETPFGSLPPGDAGRAGLVVKPGRAVFRTVEAAR
ncbi:MAG: hypothetical protein PHI35_07675 [Victivallaceae bacterium]|nr:hypothetical protein [Victivallaceae bacterium]